MMLLCVFWLNQKLYDIIVVSEVGRRNGKLPVYARPACFASRDDFNLWITRVEMHLQAANIPTRESWTRAGFFYDITLLFQAVVDAVHVFDQKSVHLYAVHGSMSKSCISKLH